MLRSDTTAINYNVFRIIYLVIFSRILDTIYRIYIYIYVKAYFLNNMLLISSLDLSLNTNGINIMVLSIINCFLNLWVKLKRVSY